MYDALQERKARRGRRGQAVHARIERIEQSEAGEPTLRPTPPLWIVACVHLLLAGQQIERRKQENTSGNEQLWILTSSALLRLPASLFPSAGNQYLYRYRPYKVEFVQWPTVLASGVHIMWLLNLLACQWRARRIRQEWQQETKFE